MTIRPAITQLRGRARDVGRLALALALLASGATAQTVDVFDVDHVIVAWDPASGPVAGYYVQVSRNAAPAQIDSVTSGLQATIPGSLGDEVQVTVMAYDAAGAPGPVSPPSPLIRFNATPAPPPPPPDDDPAPPPPDDDPAPPPPDDPPPPTAPAQRAPDDFNGDGSSDFLLRDPVGKLSIWNMDGSVKLSETSVTSLGTQFKVVESGDYDGNGKADLVWQDSATNDVTLWLLDGGRLIGALSPNLSARSGDAWKVGGSGDFDGDGADDLFLYSPVLAESAILAIDANGVASTRRLPGYGADWRVDDVGDYDLDGLAEVMWRDDRRHDLVVWDLDQAGPEAPSFVSNSVKGWRIVGSGDFDGDGVQDLFAVRSAPDKVEVWLLAEAVVKGVVSLPLPASAEWMALSVGDYDADGLSDLAWSNAISGQLEIWFSNGDAVTAVPVSSADGTLSTSRSASVVSGTEGSEDLEYRQRLCDGDFTGDGVVNAADALVIQACVGSAATGVCSLVDMDSDGQVSQQDLKRFQRSLQLGVSCVQ